MKRREFALGTAAIAVSGLTSLPAQAAKDYVELRRVVPVEAPAGQIEVIEFFSYGCVHCKTFEPIFENWVKAAPKDVAVRRVHVGFSKEFEPLQRIFYALQAIGFNVSVHAKVFGALQDEKKALNVPDQLFAWVAQQGIDRAKFEAAYKSFGVATQVRRAVLLQDAYRVEGTPALGIAGRYYTDPEVAQGFENMIKVANMLIDKERKRG